MTADIVLPDDVAREKVQLLEALGAEVEKGKPKERLKLLDLTARLTQLHMQCDLSL